MPQLMLIVGFSVGWVGGNSCCHWLSKWHIWFWSLHSTVGYYWKPFRRGHLDFSPKCSSFSIYYDNFEFLHVRRSDIILLIACVNHEGLSVGESTSIWRWKWDSQCNWYFLAPWPLSKVSLTILMHLFIVWNLGNDVREWCKFQDGTNILIEAVILKSHKCMIQIIIIPFHIRGILCWCYGETTEEGSLRN